MLLVLCCQNIARVSWQCDLMRIHTTDSIQAYDVRRQGYTPTTRIQDWQIVGDSVVCVDNGLIAEDTVQDLLKEMFTVLMIMTVRGCNIMST
jgi:hypothetical protein